MSNTPTSAIEKHFEELTDPRAGYRIQHRLTDILILSIGAVICGALWSRWMGGRRIVWQVQVTMVENLLGIDQWHTFARYFWPSFLALDPKQFQECFLRWIQAVSEISQGEVVAIDGKTVRRSHDRVLGKKAIHMVNAWASDNRLALGQVKVDEKSNDITAIPELLQALALPGCIVTIDAMGCQCEIASQIMEQGADYVLALKENQGYLHEDVHGFFEYAHQIDFQQMVSDQHQTVNKGHGRVEIRRCSVISDQAYISTIRDIERWPKLCSVARVVSERRIGDESTSQTRYFITSLGCDAEKVLHAVRSHWKVENSLHWVLDIAFREDESRIRKGYAAENMAVVRQLALNLLKQERTSKCGIKAKRLQAGWDERYLPRVLSGLKS